MQKVSIIGLTSIFSLSILFHLFAILEIVPSQIVWGGRATNPNDLMILETVSITLNSLFLFFVLIMKGAIKITLNPMLIKVLLWLMTLVFTLNTIGNLLAKSSLETMIFTPITLLLSVFCLYLALNFKVNERV